MADVEADTAAGLDVAAASIPEFVRKLFRMLDDPTSSEVVEWAEDGASFIVKDTNEFSKEVLPKHFKHNNFASFVRQLNKYDFHKVKASADGTGKRYGDFAWEFKHPNFTLHSIDQLSNIRRKPPSSKKSFGKEESEGVNMMQTMTMVPGAVPSAPEVNLLNLGQADLANYLQTLSKNYETVVRDMVMVKRNMAAQDQLMQHLLQYLVNRETGTGAISNINLASLQSASGYGDAAARPMSPRLTAPMIPSHLQSPQQGALDPSMSPASMPYSGNVGVPSAGMPMSAFSSTPAMWSPAELPSYAASASFESMGNATYPQLSESSVSAMEELSRRSGTGAEPLTVTTLGMLRLRETPAEPSSPRASNSMRVVRQTFVPSWSVPPKVLLVEDDATCRMVASKLLQIAGCTFEVAHDGMEAVSKMNLDKYDIVLMDILMPNMDGISATTQIRQFDPATPVISMTTNTSRADIMRYIDTGMNDVLGKPFSKESLMTIIQRYCSHLVDFLQNPGIAPGRVDNTQGGATITEEEEAADTVPPSKRLKSEVSL